MKRILSMIIVAALVLGTFSITGVYANTTGIDSSLIFDLDFSGYVSSLSTTAKGLKNAVNSTDIDFTTVSIGSTGTIPGTTTKYVQMNGGANGIEIKNATLNSSSTITIESWTYADAGNANDSSAHMFIHSLEGSNSANGPRIQIMGQNIAGETTNTKKWLYKYNGASGGEPYEQTLGEWVHMVFVRQQTEEGIFFAVYENGKQKVAATNKNKTLDMSSFADAFMGIGGGTYNSSVGYKGKFATVKIYNGAMTKEEAAAKYEATKGDFVADYNRFKVVDLDFSQYNREAKTGITNSVASNTSTISIPSVNGPKLVKESTAVGTRSYLQFKDEAGVNGHLRLQDASIVGKKAFSVEAWVRRTPSVGNAASGHLLVFTDDVNGTNTGHTLQFFDNNNNGQLMVRLLGIKKQTDNTLAYSSEWEHWVYTREYENGVWTAMLYINGEKKLSQTASIATDALEDTDYYMEIGGFSQRASDMTFRGGIGSFKVFNVALDDSYAKSSYNESKALYESAIITNTVTFKDQTSAVIENLSSSTTKVTAEFTLKNDTGVAITPAVFLAFYDDGVLEKVEVADTTEIVAGGTLFIDVSVDGIAPDADSEVKLFVWDGFANLKPILGMSDLQCL